MKVERSPSCFQTVRVRGCVITIFQILKLTCELIIKGQFEERCNVIKMAKIGPWKGKRLWV